MKIKTSELTGAALDWAVASALQQQRGLPSGYWTGPVLRGNFAPATCWSNGGPIVEQERICTEWSPLWGCWTARDLRNAVVSFMGPTPLIAAMRSFATSRLGDEVDIPDELTTGGT